MGGGEMVKHVSSNFVKPAGIKENKERLELSADDLCDLRFPYAQRGLLYTKPETITDIISHLKSSLSRTLDYFFPLAGRLAIEEYDDGTISFYINCNSAGVEFVHATANFNKDCILNSTYVHPLVHSLFSLNGAKNYEGLTRPLLSIQVTELIDGIFIGCSTNHSVCDGTSFWHFFNSWSEIAMGSDHISLLPVFKRWFLDDSHCPIRLPHSTIQKLSLPKETHAAHSNPVEQRVFYFTPDNIAILKAKANSQVKLQEGHNNSTTIISSLQALLGHVWVGVIRAKRLDPNETTDVNLVIGTRGRLDPPLPKGYFGNSIVAGVARAKVGDLLERGPYWGALLLNHEVKSMNNDGIRKYWKSWMENKKLTSIDEVVSRTTLRAMSSPRFKMYGNDFGWGKPIAMKSGGSYWHHGKISAVPGPVEGVIGIEVCLPVETLKHMEVDCDFMELVTEFQDLH